MDDELTDFSYEIDGNNVIIIPDDEIICFLSSQSDEVVHELGKNLGNRVVYPMFPMLYDFFCSSLNSLPKMILTEKVLGSTSYEIVRSFGLPRSIGG